MERLKDQEINRVRMVRMKFDRVTRGTFLCLAQPTHPPTDW
jgi:hypothetical protein